MNMDEYFFSFANLNCSKLCKNENGIDNVARLDEIEFLPPLNQIEFRKK